MSSVPGGMAFTLTANVLSPGAQEPAGGLASAGAGGSAQQAADSLARLATVVTGLSRAFTTLTQISEGAAGIGFTRAQRSEYGTAGMRQQSIIEQAPTLAGLFSAAVGYALGGSAGAAALGLATSGGTSLYMAMSGTSPAQIAQQRSDMLQSLTFGAQHRMSIAQQQHGYIEAGILGMWGLQREKAELQEDARMLKAQTSLAIAAVYADQDLSDRQKLLREKDLKDQLGANLALNQMRQQFLLRELPLAGMAGEWMDIGALSRRMFNVRRDPVPVALTGGSVYQNSVNSGSNAPRWVGDPVTACP